LGKITFASSQLVVVTRILVDREGLSTCNLLLAAMDVVVGMEVVGMDAAVDAAVAMGVRRAAAGMAAEEVGAGAAAVVVVAAADAEAAVVAVCGSRVFVSVRRPVGAEISRRFRDQFNYERIV
jgi:hypothetical protein